MPTSEPILPTTEVARHPPSRLLLQPIALPACSRCVLPTADVVLLARRFKFGRDVGGRKRNKDHDAALRLYMEDVDRRNQNEAKLRKLHLHLKEKYFGAWTGWTSLMSVSK